LCIADIYYLEGKLDQAIDEYKKLQRDYPESNLVLDARFGEAVCREEKGELEEALAAYQKLKDVYRNPSLIERRIARVEEKLRKKKRKWKKPW